MHVKLALSLVLVGSAALVGVSCVSDTPNPGTDASTDAAVDVASPVDATNDVIDAAPPVVVGIGAGAHHACAIRSDGSLLCWGRNAAGAVGADLSGNATCGTNIGCRPTPVVVPISGVVSVCGGDAHTCVAKQDGTVWCWGSNSNSELGHAPASDPDCGGTPCNPAPTVVSGVTGAKQVACGELVTCARTATDVYCWGNNDSAVAGLAPDVAATSTPVKITLPASDPPLDIGVARGLLSNGTAGAHACAVLNSGAIYCWGSGQIGMLGVASTTVSPCGDAGTHCSATPMQVMAGNVPFANGSRVRGGLLHTCATRTDNTVWCWGSNQWMAMGINPWDYNEYAPTQVNLGTALANDIEAHYLLVSAIDSTKSVLVWGRASGAGAIGNSSIDGPTACAYGQTCTAPLKLVSPLNVTALAGGDNFTMALTEMHEVWAWGANESGELGHKDGTAGDQNCGPCNPTPAQITMP